MTTTLWTRVALALSLLALSAEAAGCADAHASPVRPVLTAGEVETQAHLDVVVARHLQRIRSDLAARQAAVAVR